LLRLRVLLGLFLLRRAQRVLFSLLFHEPPRSTRLADRPLQRKRLVRCVASDNKVILSAAKNLPTHLTLTQVATLSSQAP
jgi:hypothetical protein